MNWISTFLALSLLYSCSDATTQSRSIDTATTTKTTTSNTEKYNNSVNYNSDDDSNLSTIYLEVNSKIIASCANRCHYQGGLGADKMLLSRTNKSINHTSLSKRISPKKPEESLLVKKVSGIVKHFGGTLIKKGSSKYELLLQWIDSE